MHALSVLELMTISEEIPSSIVLKNDLEQQIQIDELLMKTGILSSKSEVRKAILNNAISVNKNKVTSHEAIVSTGDLLHQKYNMIENGKKNKHMIQIDWV